LAIETTSRRFDSIILARVSSNSLRADFRVEPTFLSFSTASERRIARETFCSCSRLSSG
jgi:hypothetical protein